MRSIGFWVRRASVPGDVRELLVAQGSSVVASLLVTFVTASQLGPAGRGLLAFILGIANLGGAFAFGSLHVGGAHAHKSGDPSALDRTLKLGGFAAAGTVVVGAGVAAGILIVGRSPVQASSVAIGGVLAGLVCFNLVVLRTRQGLGDAREFRVAWTLQSVLYSLSATGAAFIFGSAYAILVCWLISLLLSTGYGLYGLRRCPDGLTVHVTTRAILATSWAGHIGVLGQQLLYRIDIIILAVFVSQAQLGIYSLAAAVAGMTWVASEALSLAAFSRYGTKQTLDERTRLRRRLLELNLVASVVGASVIGAGAWVFVPWILPEYTAALPLVLLLLPGVVLQGASRIVLSTIVAQGARRAALSVGIISATLSLLYIPFCFIWGTTGAAIGSTIVYCIQTVAVFFIRRRLDRSEVGSENLETEEAQLRHNSHHLRTLTEPGA